MRVLCVVILLAVSNLLSAENLPDSLLTVAADTVPEMQPASVADTALFIPPKRNFFQKFVHRMDKILRAFSERDSNYIEPQKYPFTTMIQHTENYQYTRMKLSSGNTLTLSPDVIFKIGPYFGWKWIFLGATIDLKHFFKSPEGTYIDLSLYSNQIGLDFYYIDNGDNFRIRHLRMGGDIDTSPLNGVIAQGLSERTRGFSLYYIINHRKFSYPAAFGQTTRQKRTAGSLMVGTGYAHHQFRLNSDRFYEMLFEHVPEFKDYIDNMDEDERDRQVLTEMQLSSVDYRSYTVSCGWGHNFVLARYLLIAGSLMVGASYNVTDSEYKEGISKVFRNMSLDNVSLDATARMGFVFNNDRWYAGFSGVMHNYNYRTSLFRSNNFFGTINVYGGVFF